MFPALTRLTTARPVAVLLFVAAFLINGVLLGNGLEQRLGAGGTEDPAAESSQAARLLDEHFPGSRPNLVLLVRAADGAPVDDPAIARQGAHLAERLAFEPGLAWVTSYWQTGAEELRSRDGRYALVVARVGGDETAAGRAFADLAPDYRGQIGDLVVQAGGNTAVLDEVQSTIADDLVRAELIALPITLLILVLVFGSAVAALLPLAVGLTAIIGTTGVLGALSRVTDVSIFAQNLTTLLGFGLAVDYALLMVRRYREELAPGVTVRTAIGRTLATAGRTVLFSALTVGVSLSAMLVFPTYFLRSFAYAGISVVILAALGALVVVPALLMLLGRRINALDLRRLWRRRSPAPERRDGAEDHSGGWAVLARAVMRRAPLVTVGVVGLLLLLGSPFLRVEFGTTDDRQLPPGSEVRGVHDVIRTGFDSRPTGAMDLVVRADATDDADAIGAYAAQVSALPGVARVDTPLGSYRDGTAEGTGNPADVLRSAAGFAHLTLTPIAAVEDISPESQQLVHDVRQVPAPFPVQVGGLVPALVDSQQAIGSRLGWALALIAVITVVLVFLMTGGLVLALQALVVNALSLTAMFGAVVWIFQDGNGAGLLGFTPTGFIETSLPVLMFCVAFGLSMDYGLFLLSRVKERYERTGDHRGSIAYGIQRTGGLITAAALILAVVLAAAGSSQITNAKMIGLGVALVVLVDATIVRCLLVPAVLALTGRASWWSPPLLRRLHRRVGLRDEVLPPDPALSAAAPAPVPAIPEPAGAAVQPAGSGHSHP